MKKIHLSWGIIGIALDEHTHTHMHARACAHTWTHARTHTHTHARTHTSTTTCCETSTKSAFQKFKERGTLRSPAQTHSVFLPDLYTKDSNFTTLCRVFTLECLWSRCRGEYMDARNRERHDDRQQCIIRNNIICTIYLILAALSNTEIHTTYSTRDRKQIPNFSPGGKKPITKYNRDEGQLLTFILIDTWRDSLLD